MSGQLWKGLCDSHWGSSLLNSCCSWRAFLPDESFPFRFFPVHLFFTCRSVPMCLCWHLPATLLPTHAWLILIPSRLDCIFICGTILAEGSLVGLWRIGRCVSLWLVLPWLGLAYFNKVQITQDSLLQMLRSKM